MTKKAFSFDFMNFFSTEHELVVRDNCGDESSLWMQKLIKCMMMSRWMGELNWSDEIARRGALCVQASPL